VTGGGVWGLELPGNVDRWKTRIVNFSPKMTRLILTSPEFAGQSCQLPDGTHRLGRAPQNAIVIQDESVSSEHCELLVNGPEVIVRELGSRNGTFVGAVRVKAQSGINRGQVVRFGRVEAQVDYPEIPEETTTDNTAVFSYRKVMKPIEGDEAAPEVPGIPVVFRPSRGTGGEESTMTLPRSAAETRPAATTTVVAAPASGGSGGRMLVWVWVVLGVGIVALAGWWFLRSGR
jgi:hypothetical protein